MSQQINLFNPIYLKQKKTFSAVHMVDAMAVLIVGVAGFYAYASIETLNFDRQLIETTRQYDQSRLRLAETSARYAPKKADASLEAEVNKLQVQLNARQATFTNLGVGQLAAEAGYTEYMRALARQSLTGLWLTGFKVSKGGAEMEIAGRALQPELVPSYIQRLNRERTLHGRTFDSLSMTQREGALPADTTRPAGAPASYNYTEFRLGSSYVEPASDGDAGPAAKASPGLPAVALPGVPQPAQTGGSTPR
ncbi:MAG: fimbrial assembly protein [Betaproteobacteria bacterium]|nr:MAG: fimbrial assembly protein [Betaproteobacteria bacterium]